MSQIVFNSMYNVKMFGRNNEFSFVGKSFGGSPVPLLILVYNSLVHKMGSIWGAGAHK